MAGIGKYEGVGNFEMKTPTKYGMDRTPAMYTPYKMKKGSPMYRNFGIGSKEMQGGVAAKGVTQPSPNKAFWDKVKRVGAGVMTGGLSEVVRARKKKKAEEAAAAEAAASSATGGEAVATTPHTHDETGGVVEVGGADLVTGAQDPNAQEAVGDPNASVQTGTMRDMVAKLQGGV